MILLVIELLFILLLAGILFVVYRHERALSKHAAPQAGIEEYWSGQERRRHFRFENRLDVNYSVEKKAHIKQSGKTVDISEGGMKLLLDEKLAPGTLLSLKIVLPGMNKHAEVEGEVIWSEDVQELDPSGKRLFHSGIKFLAMKEPAGTSFADYIRALASAMEKA